MADVAEEHGLGAVELGQRLGACALLGNRPRGADDGGDIGGDKTQEVAVTVVQRPAGAQAGNKEANGLLPRDGDRQQADGPRGLGPRSPRQATIALQRLAVDK